MPAIEQIELYTVGGKPTFEQDNLIQSGVLYQIVVMGEAVRGMSADLREQNLDVPWSEMVAMRNILVHRYFDVDLNIVWLVVEQNLPELKGKVQAILQELGEES